jgi:hypothetical protein
MANDITDQERQFLESLRQKRSHDLRVTIEYMQGAWDVTMTEPGTKRLARGTGATFGEAWDNMQPTQFEP